MKRRDIAVQLYSLREEAQKDFIKVLERVADIGYIAVEPAGFHNLTPQEFKNIINDLGLKMYSSHTPWLRGDDISAEIEMAGVLGLDKVVCGYGADDFKDLDAIKRTADLTNGLVEKVRAAGLTLFQHNHAFEFERLDGKLKYEIYLELCPEVEIQMDAFWSSNFGAEDPAAMMKKFADRITLVHLKDGSFQQADDKTEMVDGFLDRKLELKALGTGAMDLPAIVAEVPECVDNLIVELDYCNTDMFEAIENSYKYLTSNGLAVGNK
jgi:sugar phosphate isomerase/epimerase